MSLKNKAKTKVKNKAKKVAFKVLKPFLPFIIIIVGLFFAICTIIDAVFVQEVQTDDTSMPPAQLEIKNKCITKSEELNTCNNFIGEEKTNYLLDINSRELDKCIEWSHLYAIMAFHNMTNNTKIDENLLNKVANEFKSTFIYEKYSMKIEKVTKDEEGNENIVTEEQTQYILIESDTIIGHYKYNYKEQTTDLNGEQTTMKVFTNEELVGEKYERLRKYLKDKLHIRESDLDNDVEIVLQASNGYYEGKSNIGWLQGGTVVDTVVNDGKSLIPKGMFIWPIPGYTTITSHFGMRVHPITGAYKLHSGTDVGAPIGAKFIGMADGTVINASYNSAYGNMVMIDHRAGNCNIICTWFRNISQN